MLIRNSIPINLNFLLFVRNLLLQDEDLFPWFPFNRDVFLPYSEFDLKAKLLWNKILNTGEEEIDFANWNNNEFEFDVLFNKNTDVETYLQIIKKCYYNWLSANWKPIVELYSIKIVETYYEIISDYGKQYHKEYIVPSITLSIVYTDPPIGWTWHNREVLILSCASDIVNRKEIIEQLKIMSFGQL